MEKIVLKYVAKFILFFTRQHRKLGVHDWTASIACIALLALAVVGLSYLYLSELAQTKTATLSAVYAIVPLVFAVAAVPIVFVVKIRRNGITDADYSVATGINYEQALSGARAGFEFVGIGASKLRAEENKLRDAVRVADKQGRKVRFLLLDPATSARVFKRLENLDNTSGYSATVNGSLLFLRELARQHPDCVEIRLYEAGDIGDVSRLRMFLHDDICLVSPFSPSTGEKDQGRSLPQLRITAKGFPNADDVTLYSALRRNFDTAWDEAKGGSIE